MPPPLAESEAESSSAEALYPIGGGGAKQIRCGKLRDIASSRHEAGSRQLR